MGHHIRQPVRLATSTTTTRVQDVVSLQGQKLVTEYQPARTGPVTREGLSTTMIGHGLRTSREAEIDSSRTLKKFLKWAE
eukprot:6631623-Pyramimonas_sp.AAC.1